MESRAFPGTSGVNKEDPSVTSLSDEGTAEDEVKVFNKPSTRDLQTYERRLRRAGQATDAPSAGKGKAIAVASSVALKTYSRRTCDFQLLQVKNNYCMAAYKEVMRMAKDACTWVRLEPPVGSVDAILAEFRTPPPAGKKLEVSVATAVIPNITATHMASMMMNVSTDWSKSFFSISNYGEQYKPGRILQHLTNADTAIQSVVQVSAEVHLPTTLMPSRRFEFLRYGKVIMPRTYIIVDISSHYFGELSVWGNSLKRPSGVIIREHGPRDCEIIWVENVEVDEPIENMYSSITKSNYAFSATHWISALLWKLRRDNSTFTKVKVDLDEGAGTFLLALTEAMRRFYMECVNEHPHGALLSLVSNVEDPVRLLRNKALKFGYVGVNSFRVQAKPLAVLQFLKQKDLHLQFRSNADVETEEEEPELLFEFFSDDNSNIISLYRKKMEEEEGTRYCIEEVSRNEYCSFILSIIVTEEDVNLHMVGGVESIYEQSEDRAFATMTSGFAVMPDGPGGLQCNGSLVTFLMQLNYDPELGTFTIDTVRGDFEDDLYSIMEELNAEVVGKDD